MRIRFERAGGFAPSAMKLSYTLDSDELTDEEVSELQNLIRSADFANVAGHPGGGGRPRPDAFYYRLSINDADGDHTVEASDTDMPGSLRPLITWLTKRATRSH